MAGNMSICKILQKHYELSVQEKEVFLEDEAGRYILANLPKDIALILRRGFLSGLHGPQIPEWDKLVDYFQTESEIIPALTENPGTFTMLERMYHLQPVKGVIDNYFLLSKAGGQALRNRYEVVTRHSSSVIEDMLKQQDECLIVDFGSGPGRNMIDLLTNRPDFRKGISVDCVDIDRKALGWGSRLVKLKDLGDIRFIEANMMKLNGRYHKDIDYGLLVGVLCGMDHRSRVVLLKSLRRYFRPGGTLVAAALLDEMAKKDLLCAFILRETASWQLKFRPLGELRQAFEEAGWIYQGYFQEEPTRFYEIGVGLAP